MKTALLSLLCLTLAAASLMIGRAGIAVPAFESDFWRLIVIELRLPRTLLALATGAGLGLSGAAFQGLLRNPLADPGVTGLSACAVLGSVMMLYLGGLGITAALAPIAGIAFMLAGGFLLLFLCGNRPRGITLILAGVALNALATALTSLFLSFAPNPFAVMDILFWTMGAFADKPLDAVLPLLPVLPIGWALIFSTRHGLDALTLGEDTAESLGFSFTSLTRRTVWGTALCVGALAALTGGIAFIGLIVPHLLRPFIGQRPGALLAPSFIGGACLSVIADMTVRLLPAVPEIKIGVLTALLGAPFFLFILLKNKEDALWKN